MRTISKSHKEIALKWAQGEVGITAVARRYRTNTNSAYMRIALALRDIIQNHETRK